MSQVAIVDTGPEDTVTFIAIAWDGTPVAAVPNVGSGTTADAVKGQETWRSAEAWCWLAVKEYDSLMWSGRS